MSTYMPKASDINRTWYILDAEGQSLGRVAAKAAHILRGKHKPTGWIGGLKEIKYKDLMATAPERAMTIAVNGMLPNNTLGRKAMTRLRVYKDANHKHEAQKPVAYEL